MNLDKPKQKSQEVYLFLCCVLLARGKSSRGRERLHHPHTDLYGLWLLLVPGRTEEQSDTDRPSEPPGLPFSAALVEHVGRTGVGLEGPSTF